MTFDVRAAALRAGIEGTGDVHVWRTQAGEIVDTWVTNPGSLLLDDGHTERLSRFCGEPVVYLGKMSTDQMVQELETITTGVK